MSLIWIFNYPFSPEPLKSLSLSLSHRSMTFQGLSTRQIRSGIAVLLPRPPPLATAFTTVAKSATDADAGMPCANRWLVCVCCSSRNPVSRSTRKLIWRRKRSGSTSWGWARVKVRLRPVVLVVVWCQWRVPVSGRAAGPRLANGCRTASVSRTVHQQRQRWQMYRRARPLRPPVTPGYNTPFNRSVGPSGISDSSSVTSLRRLLRISCSCSGTTYSTWTWSKRLRTVNRQDLGLYAEALDFIRMNRVLNGIIGRCDFRLRLEIDFVRFDIEIITKNRSIYKEYIAMEILNLSIDESNICRRRC